MGKWIGVGLLVLVGFSLIGGQYALMGVVMLGIAGVIIWMAVRGSNSSSDSTPARPTQLSSARFDAREEIARAERQAARRVRAAEENAEKDGYSALCNAMTFLANEARWS